MLHQLRNRGDTLCLPILNCTRQQKIQNVENVGNSEIGLDISPSQGPTTCQCINPTFSTELIPDPNVRVRDKANSLRQLARGSSLEKDETTRTNDGAGCSTVRRNDAIAVDVSFN